IDVGSVLEKKVGNLEVVVEDCPSKRCVENLLHTDLAPFWFSRVYAGGGGLIREVAECRPALRVEPASHAFEVAVPGCMEQVDRHGQDAKKHGKHMGFLTRERKFNGLRWRGEGPV